MRAWDASRGRAPSRPGSRAHNGRWRAATAAALLAAAVLAAAAMAAVLLAAVATAAPSSAGGPAPIHCFQHVNPNLDEPRCPVQGVIVDVAPVSGVVFVTQPGDVRRRLDEPHTILVGSIIDATRGRFRLTADQRSVGIRFATADFFGGRAVVEQGLGAKHAAVLMQLVDSNVSVCASQSRAVIARNHHQVQHLFGSGKGHFGISGHYVAAIVQGTQWQVTDYCDGSGVTVTHGAVAADNFATGQTVIVHQGHSYFAPAVPVYTFPTQCPQGNVPFGSVATISGTFTPPRVTPAPQADYTQPSGAIIRHTLQLDSAGAFSDQITVTQRGVWSVSVHLANPALGGSPASCSFAVT